MSRQEREKEETCFGDKFKIHCHFILTYFVRSKYLFDVLENKQIKFKVRIFITLRIIRTVQESALFYKHTYKHTFIPRAEWSEQVVVLG